MNPQPLLRSWTSWWWEFYTDNTNSIHELYPSCLTNAWWKWGDMDKYGRFLWCLAVCPMWDWFMESVYVTNVWVESNVSLVFSSVSAFVEVERPRISNQNIFLLCSNLVFTLRWQRKLFCLTRLSSPRSDDDSTPHDCQDNWVNGICHPGVRETPRWC